MKPILNIVRQVLTWSATVMLMVQSVGWPAAGCGCGSIRSAADRSSKCPEQARQVCCGVDRCHGCGTSQESCCESRTKDGATATANADSDCGCGQSCHCGMADGNDLPIPAIPVRESTHEQTQLLVVLFASIFDPAAAHVGGDLSGFESVGQYSFRAQQVCALLSRFTC